MERYLITIEDRKKSEKKTMEGELVSIVARKSSHDVSCALLGHANLVDCSELYAGLKSVMSALEDHAKKTLGNTGLGERMDLVKNLIDGLVELVDHD